MRVTGVVAVGVAALGVLLTLSACSTTAGPSSGSELAPLRFRSIQAKVRDVLAAASRGDARAIRAEHASVGDEGIALIRAPIPAAVTRIDAPRYLEGRAQFGAALKAWVIAVESGSDAALFAATRSLDDAVRGWIDATLGREPETSL